MRISVGDVRLFVDTAGSAVAIENGVAVERPTMIFLHGGPGFDHLSLRSPFEPLADQAYLIFYDHRGNGRSDHGDPEKWTLKQWAKDLAVMIEALSIDRPIIFGQSFGGMVAQQFAVDYPGLYSALIISASLDRFDIDAIVDNYTNLFGPEEAELARRFFTDRTPDVEAAYRTRCLPLYTVSSDPIGSASIMNPLVSRHFFREGGEGLTFDFGARLHEIDAPTLVIGGDRDPVIPVSNIRAMAERFKPGVAEFVILENCGHGPGRDQPAQTMGIMRRFIERVGAA